jgi:hypothetical protein
VPPSKRTLKNNVNKGVNIVENKHYILIYINLKGYTAFNTNIEMVLKMGQDVNTLLTLLTLIPLS